MFLPHSIINHQLFGTGNMDLDILSLPIPLLMMIGSSFNSGWFCINSTITSLVNDLNKSILDYFSQIGYPQLIYDYYLNTNQLSMNSSQSDGQFDDSNQFS